MARNPGTGPACSWRVTGCSLLAAPSLGKKTGLSEVSCQCMWRVTACQLAGPGRTVWSAQDLRAASGARTGLAELGSGRGRDAKSKMLAEPVPDGLQRHHPGPFLPARRCLKSACSWGTEPGGLAEASTVTPGRGRRWRRCRALLCGIRQLDMSTTVRRWTLRKRPFL